MSSVRHAVKSLAATPVVSAVAVLSLALGIGANTALFTLIDGLLLRSLPVRDPCRLALVIEGNDVQTSWTNPIWEQLRDREKIFDGAFAWTSTRFDLARGGETEFVNGMYASGRFFDVLGVPAVLGRTFSAADDSRGGGREGPVAVLSHAFWQRRFGGAADAVGRTITLDRVTFTIVGVTPPGFTGPEPGIAFDVAVPLGTESVIRGVESALDSRSTWWLSLMVRLKPDQTIESATRVLRQVQPQVRDATTPPDWTARFQAEYLKEGFTLQPAAGGPSSLRLRYERPLLTLMVVVGLVLLIACANIANLLLARATARSHELAVRLALGASRGRMAAESLVESLVLAGLGALFGLLFAQWGSRLLVSLISTRVRVVTLDLSLDWRVLGFTVAVAAVTAVSFGMVPALRAAHVQPQLALADRGRSVIGGSRIGLGGSLVVAQVALSLVLVAAGGLFLRTFTALAHLDTGFDQDPLVVMTLDATRVQPENRVALFERVRAAAAAVPGVESAATSMVTPISGTTVQYAIEVVGEPPRPEKDRGVLVNLVGPGWFSTYGMRILAGRDVTARDAAGAPDVAVVNREFVRRFLGGRDPIGRVVRDAYPRPGKPPVSREVVGVVSDAAYRSLREPIPATMYLSLQQTERPWPSARVTIRAARGDPSMLVRPAAAAVGRVNPDLALTFRSLGEQVAASIVQERLIATLSGFFGGLGLLLAGLGLYGLASYSVTRRRAEIGIRMALGAPASTVVRGVMVRLGALVAAGLAIGAVVSLWAVRFVSTLLFGVQARDASTLLAAIGVLVAVAAAASWNPARRAARIDPVEVLRQT
jgi:putative ABC transport system permease protein